MHTEYSQLKLSCLACSHFALLAQTLTTRFQEILVVYTKEGQLLWRQHVLSQRVRLYCVIVKSNRSWYLFRYSRLIWQQFPLCLLKIKSPSDFSCSLEVSQKVLLVSYEVESTVIIMPSHGQSQPIQFASCEFFILCQSCACCRQIHSQILQWCEVSHKALLSVGSEISFVFPQHKLFFRMHI
jgi:predicted neutral ceramidase superfamily lipid hydrolase